MIDPPAESEIDNEEETLPVASLSAPVVLEDSDYQIPDEWGLKEAYNDEQSVVHHGDMLYIAGTHTLRGLLFALFILLFALFILLLHCSSSFFALSIILFALFILLFALFILLFALFSLLFALFILLFALFILLFALFTKVAWPRKTSQMATFTKRIQQRN